MATSLEILRPSPSPVKELNPVGTLARDLEDRSSTLIKLIALQDWEHPDIERYLDPASLANQSRKSSSRARKACCDRSTIAGIGPELKILSVSTEVEEDEGQASVWMLLSLPRDVHGLVREIITIMQWRIDAGRWKCYEQTAPQAGSGFGI
ncbi:uncharacterized protein RCC_06358 [Ramularia collo-cygni]|uniref:SnoaL-like domain-containing protein n=1 Tax=Ramularia collo-cygni TaxID=112498 RepID=A0A2D3UYG6_9PEZI|nr:uncharacterized protein RCC_06358 [Ramularia collo-cygni]CZT20498.1 uncharacterized protein RCC_06358 [Ramularia collo-cygni]